MKPKFKNTHAWEQAQLLMQPIFIRVIDNIRKQLDRSQWKGTYEEVHIPYPGYKLHLTSNDKSVTVDIWELCYQICFRNYQPTHAEISATEVEIDTTLIDEVGEVDWQHLEEKAKQLVEEVFGKLPGSP
ncbi:hypothetical protein IQ249_05970 [Lusitaniella coriacea LEGE 07157]|uniref:Uncharacterized protein n=1 Tax=Lusitaniella coriacea LEGE 07157 TaxID=945747 RepID=A0A8J7B7J7_9CYAN|nr:hypothetical protein [Lusitaniella coriacea]MBE9115444.1 hypothetical protein [Lusitaniella coriacea LEGE 07157]